ncbi:MAG: hypothetical protein AB7P07_07775 [Hyphomonadaceae bacterium]
MTAAWKQYKPKLAIYDILDKPGGISVDAAMQRAEQAVENYRGQAMSALGDAVAKLERSVRAADAERTEDIYAQSLFVLDIAGIYNPALCRAANSLCDLAQRMKTAGQWDWPSVAVHVSAMRLLMQRPDETDPAAQAVLKGLGSVVAKYPDPTPEPPPKV